MMTLFERERLLNGRWVPENPWLQLSDMRGPGEGTYIWHENPREPYLCVPRDWVWCSSWGVDEWEYFNTDGWTGITLMADTPNENCTARRMPWCLPQQTEICH